MTTTLPDVVAQLLQRIANHMSDSEAGVGALAALLASCRRLRLPVDETFFRKHVLRALTAGSKTVAPTHNHHSNEAESAVPPVLHFHSTWRRTAAALAHCPTTLGRAGPAMPSPPVSRRAFVDLMLSHLEARVARVDTRDALRKREFDVQYDRGSQPVLLRGLEHFSTGASSFRLRGDS